MKTKLYPIELPLLPTGWNYVAYRTPKKGEYYVSSFNLEDIVQARHDHSPTHNKLIIERD